MQQTSNFYYPRQGNLNFNVQEQIYSLRKTTDAFLAKLLFKHDENPLSRVLWAPRNYNIYRRKEMLAENLQSTAIDALHLPFCSYFRDEGWQIDGRPSAQQVSSVMSQLRWGHDDTGVEAQAIAAERTYDAAVIFASERDATIAQDTIFWWNNRPHWDTYSIFAGGTEVRIPVTMELVAGPTIAPDTHMKEWMQEMKLSVVDFAFRLRTPLLKIPTDQTPVHLTEEVYFYFNARHFNVPEEALPDDIEGWDAMSEELFAFVDSDELPAPAGTDLLNIEYTINKWNNTAKFTWEYSQALPESITFYLHKGYEIEKHTLDLSGYDDVTEAPTSFTIPVELSSGSIYDVAMTAHTPPTGVAKYHFQIKTPDDPDEKKGLAGLKGMTL